MKKDRKTYRLGEDPGLKPVWKEVLFYPYYFLKELFSDMKSARGKQYPDFKDSIEDEFKDFFNTSGDWVVKIYVLFVLVILPLLMNAIFGD